MTRKRINQLIDLIEKANELGWATIQAGITISDHVVVHVYDSRKGIDCALSLYYDTEAVKQLNRHRNDRNIITIRDTNLDAAEHFLHSIIRWYKENNDD